MRLLTATIYFLSVTSLTFAQSADDKKVTAAFINNLHIAGGGYRPAPLQGTDAAKPSLGATSAAIRALAKFGGTPVDAKADAAFIDRCFDATSGGFADQPGGQVNPASTAIGLMAVVALKMSPEKYAKTGTRFLGEKCETFEQVRLAAAAFEALNITAPKKEAWLEVAVKDRHANGVWGEGPGMARATGSAAALVLRLSGELPQSQPVLRAMRAGQRPDGGFGPADQRGSDLDTSYRVMRAFHMLKELPNEPRKLRQFVISCRNADGGFGPRPGEPSTLSGVYYAGTILGWLTPPG